MRALKEIPFYTFLLAVYFCLSTAAQNTGSVTLSDVLVVGVPLILAEAFLFLLFYFISKKNLLFTGLAIFIFSAWYLFFGAIKDAVEPVPLLHSYLVILPLILSINVALVFILRRRPHLFRKLTFFLNILLIIYCLFDGFMILRQTFTQKKSWSDADSFVSAAVAAKPDVYFLLFDGYAGYPSLRDSFNFKNEVLRNTLDSMDFQVVPSSSNYTLTPLSMSSIFNMEYGSGLKEGIVHRADIQRSIRKIQDAAVFQIFEKMGYRVNNFSIFDVGNQEPVGGGIFFPLHRRLLVNKIFHYRLLKDIAPRFPASDYSLALAKRILWADLPQYNDRVEENLLARVRLPATDPQFVYAHFMMPHFPYFLDSIGRKIPDSILLSRKADNAYNRYSYLSYLKYCNKKIIEYSREIILHHPDAAIIIMSDHGFRGYHPYWFEPAYLDNICEIRFPGRQAVWPQTTTPAVNFFRRYFNTYYNQHFPLLGDSSVKIREQGD